MARRRPNLNDDQLASYIRNRCARTDTGCLLWLGAVSDKGYGTIGRRGRVVGVHRLLFELEVGAVAEGSVVMHSCDNRRCCETSHLSVGTQLDNMRDAARKGRNAHGEKNGKARLTARQVREIRSLRSEGATQEALAETFGMSRRGIRAILDGRNWRREE